MDFVDQLKQFSKRIEGMKDTIQTEEATKTSLVMPFFSMMGYDVFNPNEFVPEYTADVGIKKGEKVDYAIMNTNSGNPEILIEVKCVGASLDKHNSQLFRYFGTTEAKFAILTDGATYRFYTDLEQPNKMDPTPFLEVNLLNIRDGQIAELKKFHKTSFNVDAIFDTASDLKYSNEFRNIFASQLQNPSDDFLRFFLNSVYSGVKTQAIMEKFRPILKKALNQHINTLMNDKIKLALDNSSEETQEEELNLPETKEEQLEKQEEPKNRIVTTQEEMGAYFIIKMILKEIIPLEDVSFKDTIYYFTILYKNKTTKWICRLKLSDNRKLLILPDENKQEIKYNIENIYQIEKFADKLKAVVQRYL